jgi:hypothetical protein
VFCPLSHTSSKSCFLPGLAWDRDPPTCASHIAGITGIRHHSQLVCLLRWGLANILPGCTQTMSLLISTSQVDGITVMSQCTWPRHCWHKKNYIVWGCSSVQSTPWHHKIIYIFFFWGGKELLGKGNC